MASPGPPPRPPPHIPVPLTMPFTPGPPSDEALAACIAAAAAAARGAPPPAPVPLPTSVLGQVVPYDDENVMILLEKIRVSPRVLARGKFGYVSEVNVPGVEKNLVVKCIHHTKTRQSRDRIIMEINTGKRLRHKNIASFSGCLQTKEGAWLFFSKIEGRTFWNIIDSYADYRVPENVARPLVKQLFHGLHYLQTAGVLHRDIKGDNVMVSEDGVVKILDFGLATDISHGKANIKKRYNHTHPPEYYIEYMGGVDHKSDIFMAGLLIFQMCTNTEPFGNLAGVQQPQQMRAVAAGFVSPNPMLEAMSSDLVNLCKLLMSYFPRDRPVAAGALNHPWFEPRVSELPLPLVSHHDPRELTTVTDLDYRAVLRLSTNLTLPVEDITMHILGQPHGWLRIAYNAKVNDFRELGLAPLLPPPPGSVIAVLSGPPTPAAGGCAAETAAALEGIGPPGPAPSPGQVSVASAGSRARRWFSCACPGCTS